MGNKTRAGTFFFNLILVSICLCDFRKYLTNLINLNKSLFTLIIYVRCYKAKLKKKIVLKLNGNKRILYYLLVYFSTKYKRPIMFLLILF